METLKYSDILSHLEGFDPWLLRLGLTPRNDDRIHRAFGVVKMAEEAARKGKETGEYSKLQPEHLFPLVEALEAHNIYCAFANDTSAVLASALKRALSGPVQPIDEKDEASRDGRNVWFELALASEWRSRGAVVESGALKDGARGVAAINAHGGTVLVQAPETAVVPHMPRAAIQTGFADGIMHPSDIADALISLCMGMRRIPSVI